MTKDMIATLTNNYGPFAFGVVSFLVIWFAAIRPELDRRSLDWESYRVHLQSLETIVHSQQQVGVSLESASETMLRAVEIMQAITPARS